MELIFLVFQLRILSMRSKPVSWDLFRTEILGHGVLFGVHKRKIAFCIEME